MIIIVISIAITGIIIGVVLFIRIVIFIPISHSLSSSYGALKCSAVHSIASQQVLAHGRVVAYLQCSGVVWYLVHLLSRAVEVIGACPLPQ